MFHIVFLVKRKVDMSQDEFTDYWINQHTPLTARVPGLREYRCFPMTGFEDEQPAYDAVAYVAFDDEAAWKRAEASDEFKTAVADAVNFQTVEGTHAFRAQEYVIEPRPA